jgi:hypothetical protein
MVLQSAFYSVETLNLLNINFFHTENPTLCLA